MSDSTGSFAPAIFLLSDGEPTDDYELAFEQLSRNNWFKKAIKVAIAIGDEANKNVLAQFTGSKEAVVTVHTPETLKKWIQFVSVRASEVASKSANINTQKYKGTPSSTNNTNINQDVNNSAMPKVSSKQDDIIKEIQAQAIENIDWDSFDDDDAFNNNEDMW